MDFNFPSTFKDDVSFISTPTDKWFHSILTDYKCCEFIAVSPFIGNAFLNIINCLSSESKKILVTRTDLRYFAAGISDITTICKLAEKGTSVFSLSKLHAKIYVIDENYALITSANATNGGLKSNLEFGVSICNSSAIKALKKTIVNDCLNSKESLIEMSTEQLYEIRESIKLIKPLLKIEKIDLDISDKFEESQIEVDSLPKFINTFKGWTKLVLEEVIRQEVEFTLSEIYKACIIKARKEYPDNKHIEAKIRQQLQILRDFGLLRFLGRGKYIKNIKV